MPDSERSSSSRVTSGSNRVRCRFAPSPTGYLHIGGARTALFNYLLARRSGGVFIVRIEDTDQNRNIRGAESKLLDDLRWLGLPWDEGPQVGGPRGPYHQSQRLEAYHGASRRLLDEGKAYYAWDTPAELDALRAAAKKAQKNFRYPRPARFPSEAEADNARGAGRPVVVRLAMPGHGFTVVDQILGDVTIGAEELDDFVLLKSDGWPTYHFAVVVDDEHMQITHVLRGQEHLMNTPRHMALQAALGFAPPAYAHLPIILNMDGGSKMSKREKDRAVRTATETALKSGQREKEALRAAAGVESAAFDAWLSGVTQLESDALRRLAHALTVSLPEIEIHDFRASGYLPEVLINFIALLGWSPGQDREKMTLDGMCGLFSLDRVGKTNARFDRAKLLSFNTDAVAAASPQRKLAGLRDYIDVSDDSALRGLDDARLSHLLEVCKGFRIFRDIEEKTAALFLPDERLRYDADAVKKVWLKNDGEGLRVLRELLPKLMELSDWATAALETALTAFCNERGLKLNAVAQPLRVALCGRTISPPIFETLALAGRERTLARIRRAIEQAERVGHAPA